MIPKRHDHLAYVDERGGIFVGRFERWNDGALILLLADQEHEAADQFYEKYFFSCHRPLERQTFYAWPSDMMQLTFTRKDLPGNWKRIVVATVSVVSLI